jgi:catechol 2,3-dioxygenase-like lactoylglutathione lyase family enzyme
MSETATKTHITRLATIGVPVADQDRALRFYIDKLGFEKRMDVPFGDGQRWVEVAPPGALSTIALMRPRSGDAAGIDTNIRLRTGDAAADHVAMQGMGIDTDAELLLYPVPMFAFRDPDGNTFRIVEMPPDR